MSTYAYRFVGQENLSNRLSDFDLEQFFQLTADDVSAITKNFRSDSRAPVALMVLFMRASGRPLAQFSLLPRNLLRYVGESFKTSAPTIASLRAIYQRSQTLYKHQLWAKTHLGLKELDAEAQASLIEKLSLTATEAAHADDLLTTACHWLFDHKRIIPGQRKLQDWARNAFAAIEAAIYSTIVAVIPATTLKTCRESVYGLRSESGATHMEWLKTPSKRDGPSSLGEILEKIQYLKSLTVHDWPLEVIAIPKLRAYAQQIQSRRPAKTRELKDTTQVIELICFLRMTLLELTDLAVHQGARRSQQLFRESAQKAKALLGRPDTKVREEVLKARAILNEEGKAWKTRCVEADQLLRELLETPQESFVSHVRQALTADHPRVKAYLNGIAALEFGGQSDDSGYVQWNTWRTLQSMEATELPPEFDVPPVGQAWQKLVDDPDTKQGLRAFAACTMMSMRKSLRNGKLWINHSLSFRERDQMLISPADWERNRQSYLTLLGLPASADEFLEPLLGNLKVGVTAVSEACAQGKVSIGTDGMLHLPPVSAVPDDLDPRKTRDHIYKLIGRVQLPDVLLEIDSLCNFSESLLGHRAESVAELLALYGALLAHGTDIDAKSVASMIPGTETTQVSVVMRALETHGRLRRANLRVTEFQGRVAIAAHWGSGEKASADMMSVDVSRHLWSARVDPRRRTYAAGIYTHQLDRWGIVYDQPIVLNERQAGVAIEGVEMHNRSQDRIRLSLLAVDTHGYTNPAMSVSKLLGFDLCPRLRDLAERKLYLPPGFVVPEGIERIVVKRLSLRSIRAGWDELLRIIASVRIGKISAELALRFLSSAAQGDQVHKAAEHLGRLLRTSFLCDYVTIDDFRREIHTLLSRGESVHQLQRAIYTGQLAPERGRRRDEMKAISGSHALLTNIVLAWNTHHMNEVVDRLRKSGVKIDDAWLRRMGPAHFAHINFRGTFRFGIEKYAQSLIKQSAATYNARTAAAV